MQERFSALGMKSETLFNRTLQMRFVGQAFEIDVPLPEGELSEESLRDAFDAAHRLVYFHAGGAGLGGKRVEIVGFRIGASVPETCVLPDKTPPSSKPARRRTVHENREQRECTLCSRSHLDDQGGLPGPLLVEDDTSTIYVPPGWRARNDAAGNLILNRTKESS
jgi:N-methylhydantoinase A